MEHTGTNIGLTSTGSYKVATIADLELLKSELLQNHNGVYNKIQKEMGALREELVALRAESRTVKWIIMFTIGAASAVGVLMQVFVQGLQ